MRKSGWLVAMLLLAGGVAHATDALRRLESTDKQLEQSKEKQEELAVAVGEAAEDLEQVQQKSVELAGRIREIEQKIADKNTSLEVLERERSTKQAALGLRQNEIGRLVQGMIRMQRLPRQFVIAQPGNADELLRTASALDITYRAVTTQIQELQEQMSELQTLRTKVAKTQDQLRQTQTRLETEQADLADLVAKRQDSYRSLNRDHAATRDRVTLLSKQSANLHDLIGKLEEEERLFQQMGAPQAKPLAPSRPSETLQASLSDIKPSASGTLIHRFGEKTATGDIRGGHVLRTAAKAMVTAPQNGKVVFSGQFMDYGKMIIIQHDEGFHTVLAGFGQVTVEPGQRVRSGEPVGVMGATPDERELYLELRKNSKPIDPSRWIGNVGGGSARAG